MKTPNTLTPALSAIDIRANVTDVPTPFWLMEDSAIYQPCTGNLQEFLEWQNMPWDEA